MDQYKKEILNEDGKHKHERGMDVADQYGCGERICIKVKVDDKDYSFPHFSCILGQCDKCDEKDYQAPEFETKCKDETIRYSRFTTHAQCSFHKAMSIQYHDTKPKVRCGLCEELTEEEKKVKKARIVKKVFRTIHSELLSEFVAKKGTYAKEMRKMLSHKYRVRLLGKSHKKRTRYKHATKRKNSWKIDRDFSERFLPLPNNQAQHEYFNKDESLGMEGITVYFKPKGKDECERQ